MQFGPLRQRNFALLWWAGLISMAGNWTLKIALPIYVLQLTGSAVATSAAVAAALAPVLLVGLVAGVYVDRWDRRKVMVTVSALQALVVLPLLAVDSAGSVWIVYAVLFCESALAQFFMPAENALLPKLVPDAQLPVANSLNALNNNIARLGGPALGGVLAAAIGLTGVVAVDAVSYAVAALLISAIRGSFRATATTDATTDAVAAVAEPAARPGVRRELADGLRVIRHSPMTKAILVIAFLLSIGEGIMGGMFPIFVTGPLHGGVREVGWLMSAQAVGGVLGGLAGPLVAARISTGRLAALGLVFFGLIDLAIFNYPRWADVLWPELVMFAAVGIPSALGGAALMTLIQRAVSDEYLGRVFAVLLVAESTAGLGGAALAGAFADTVGVIALLTIQGAVPLLCGIGFGFFVRRSGQVAEPEPAAVMSPATAAGEAR
ncbi:MAG: MFS transporter [Hamadaea sp.]|nr:MFS transporter [Hamadaea sp.]